MPKTNTTEAKTKSKELQRLSINITPETAKILQDLKADKNMTVTEIVRNAVSVYDFFLSELSEGRSIQTMDKDGSSKRDVIMF